MTGQINIVFDKEKLEETVRMLRGLSGQEGPAIECASAEDNFMEALRLAEIVEIKFQSGNLIKINSKLFVAEGASKTLVVLEPTDRLIEYFATFGVETLQG